MRPIKVVLAQRDPAVTDNLVRSVEKQFHAVETVNTLDEIRRTIARLRAPLAIVDLELVNFSELAELCREFPATAFVATHRLADDAMWSQSLAMGAVDCRYDGDLLRILQASDRYLTNKEARDASV